MARALKEHPEIKKVEIQGHTDNIGDDFYNLKLGQERAESVKRALVKRGRGAGAPDRQGVRRGEPHRPQRHAGRQGQEPARRVRDRELSRGGGACAASSADRLVAGAARRGRRDGLAVRAQTFPATFSPLYCARGFMIDGYRDQSGAVDERDLVGTPAEPAGFRAVDGQFLYLRLRLDASPVQGNGLRPFAWGFELSTDGDPTDYEILIAVDGAAETVALYRNTVTTVPTAPPIPPISLRS